MRAAFAHVWRVAEGKLARFDMYTDTLLIDRAMRQGQSSCGDGARIGS
jgi:ketosteroid isomerase-like protein